MLQRACFPRVGVVLGYVLVAVAFAWPLPLHLDTAFTGDPGGDTGVYVWNQWVFQDETLVHHHSPLSTDKIFALSQRADLTQHNYTAFLDLLALPLIPWLGVVTTFNVVYLFVTALTAIATYALVRHVTPADRAQAWLAGVVFAWSPILVARSTGHFSLVAAAPLPAFLLFLMRADRSRQLRCAALAGLCMAWAAFCDVYYAIYCLMIAAGYLVSRVVRVTRADSPAPAPWRWTLDLLILVVSGLVTGLLLGRGGRFDVFGVSMSVRGLYTPVLVLTVLIVARLILALRPHLALSTPTLSSAAARAMVVGVLACAGPLSPVLYGLGQRVLDGRFVNPPIFWRSSPRGVDLSALFEPNPNNPLVRRIHDAQGIEGTSFVDYTSALSLVSLAVVVVAIWRAGYRPRTGWIWMTVGFALLSLGPFIHVGGVNTHIPGPWSLLRYVPLVGAARSPARFAVVAALGVAVLLAGALAALTRRYPHRRHALTFTIGAALILELFPAPRTLYSADIPSFYGTIASDPRPIRILELPAGVRDGASSAGNFSARSQYYQTLHGKALIGGYLSRVSKRRVDEIRKGHPVYAGLITLSEGGTLAPELDRDLRDKAPQFLQRARIGYVVINHASASQSLIAFAREAFGLEEMARDGPTVLYRPTALISSH